MRKNKHPIFNYVVINPVSQWKVKIEQRVRSTKKMHEMVAEREETVFE